MAKSRRKQAAPAPPTAAVTQTTSAEPSVTARVDAPAPDPLAAERITRQRERAEARRRQEQAQTIRNVVIGLVAVLAIGVPLVWWLSRPPAVASGRAVPIAGWDHINPGEKGKNYTTVPPTSGDHYPSSAAEGVHKTPIQDEFAVHNLEHGQILVQYTCTDCPDLAAKLEAIAARYPKWVLVGPYPDPRVGAKIVLTSWGFIDTFDEYDEQRIVNFIEARKNKGRENVIME
ncbi:MAG: DUF3105 domain-containing protein [Chloroflexi bacterium]|nr:DUF3105 domain-containing protein [Chloroflexota bacterium]